MGAGVARIVRFVAGSVLGIAAGAIAAALFSSERRRAIEECARAKLAEARRAAAEAEVQTEAELWARFRQLVGLSSPDGSPASPLPPEQ
jgi:hypothetical protein